MARRYQFSLAELLSWTGVLGGCSALVLRGSGEEFLQGVLLLAWTLVVLAILRLYGWLTALRAAVVVGACLGVLSGLTPVQVNPRRGVVPPVFAVLLGIAWFGTLAAIHWAIVAGVDALIRRITRRAPLDRSAD